MTHASQQIFVYSSLRSGFHHPAYAYISKYFELVAEASVQGKLFDLGDNIVGVPSQESVFIQGELYTIKAEASFSWAIAQLDDYEGIQNDEQGEPLYRRSLTTVFYNGQTTIAWVYWFNRTVTEGHFIESGDILTYLAQKK